MVMASVALVAKPVQLQQGQETAHKAFSWRSRRSEFGVEGVLGWNIQPCTEQCKKICKAYPSLTMLLFPVSFLSGLIWTISGSTRWQHRTSPKITEPFTALTVPSILHWNRFESWVGQDYYPEKCSGHTKHSRKNSKPTSTVKRWTHLKPVRPRIGTNSAKSGTELNGRSGRFLGKKSRVNDTLLPLVSLKYRDGQRMVRAPKRRQHNR
jgi:hypothetical protein